MQYTTLGRTGVKVSRLCLGTMNFGGQCPEPQSCAMMDAAIDAGINFFDTADLYGPRRAEGVTEQIIGRWLAASPRRRDQIILATKVWADMDRDGGDHTMKRGLSAAKIRRACEASLGRLQTDHIDLYQMHHISRQTPWQEIWQAMDVLIRQGKISYVGSSNFAAFHIIQANAAAARQNLLGLTSEQCRYSLAFRRVEMELLPACRSQGVGVIPFSPLAGGLLAGVLQGPTPGRRAGERVQSRLPKIRPQIQAWEDFCQQFGSTPANIALAWLLQNPAITSPIIGPRTMEQLKSSLAALEITLNDEQNKRLDEIWPGPGGESPEAYAW